MDGEEGGGMRGMSRNIRSAPKIAPVESGPSETNTVLLNGLLFIHFRDFSSHIPENNA